MSGILEIPATHADRSSHDLAKQTENDQLPLFGSKPIVVDPLNNFRHHADDHCRFAFDPFSNALNFDGWADLDVTHLRAAIPDEQRWPHVTPCSWLMTTGWRRRGLLSTWEMPRS